MTYWKIIIALYCYYGSKYVIVLLLPIINIILPINPIVLLSLHKFSCDNLCIFKFVANFQVIIFLSRFTFLLPHIHLHLCNDYKKNLHFKKRSKQTKIFLTLQYIFLLLNHKELFYLWSPLRTVVIAADAVCSSICDIDSASIVVICLHAAIIVVIPILVNHFYLQSVVSIIVRLSFNSIVVLTHQQCSRCLCCDFCNAQYK